MKFNFRPHHFLCALCFRGKGYSPSFIANFQTMMDHLNGSDGDNTPIHITAHTDSICAPCPHRTDLTCTSQEKILKLDSAHQQALAIETNTTITWLAAKKRIAEKMSLEKFHQICKECEWKKLGICEKVLSEFLKNKES